MNEFMSQLAHPLPHGHLLLEAARLALEVNLTPRFVLYEVAADGTPIQITANPPDPQPALFDAPFEE
jgi:hypothetical protein